MWFPTFQPLPIAVPMRVGARLGCFLLCVGLVVAIAAADYATGYEISLTLLYLAPVFIATWALGLRSGLVMSVLATAAWYVTFAGSNPYSHPVYYGWEAMIRASTAIVFAIVIERLRLALARSDERFVMVLQGLDAAVYVADERSGDLLYANDRARAAFGADVKTLTDITDRFAAGDENARDAPAPGQREVRDRVSGEWYLVSGRSIRWVDGSRVTLHTATDISQRKQVERLAQDRQERLEMTSRLIAAGEMASTLAHELNQPLAAILNYNTGCAELLRSGAASAPALLEGLEKSSEQAERAGAIVQQVRDFIARRAPQFESCDLSEVLGEAVRLVAAQASRYATIVDVDASNEFHEVEVDRVMLQQLVINLAQNAVEAMEATPPHLRRLTIRWRCSGGSVEVEVADRGPGLPSELAKGLFVPFFSTKRGGLGLGLQICRSVAEHHEGRLWAAGNPGGGTVFHFCFPATRV